MFKKYLAAAFLATNLFVVAYASAENETGIKEKVIAEITNSASQLGISPEVYKEAVDNFMRMYLGDTDPNLTELTDIPELSNLESVNEATLLKIINNQKSEFASYLGLPVSKFDAFIEHISTKLDNEQLQLIAMGLDGEIERIEIKCEEACSTNSLSIGVHIMEAAKHHGIGQYEKFVVGFVGSSGNVYSESLWKYNNFSGAWKIKDLSRPCPTCPFD